MACFHQPEVREATLARVKFLLETYPNLSGLALDGFGYQNLRDCQCAESQGQATAYVAHLPELKPEEAREKFFFDSLVNFQNEVAEAARKIKPDVKLAAHIWPTYTPRPLYGKHLDIDYCAQTTAWFFKPYWSDEKVTDYTRRVVNEAREIHPRQQGIPFVGYSFCGGPRRGSN